MAHEDKIRPGTVITEKNYENYSEELKKLFTPAYFITVSKGIKNGWITIPVVKKRDYPLREGFAKATRNNIGKFRVGEKNKIIGKWTSGTPFPQPETPEELAWDIYRRGQLADDFEVWRQKINTIMTFKTLVVKDFLVPGCYNEKPPEPFIKRNCFQVDWEKRPLYILEVDMNDKDYVYGKRVIYAEKEDGTFSLYGGENYDQKGRLWRSWTQIVQAQDIKTLFRCWWGFLITDHLTGHSTMLPMYPKLRDVLVPQEVFTIRGLLRRAK